MNGDRMTEVEWKAEGMKSGKPKGKWMEEVKKSFAKRGFTDEDAVGLQL